MLGISSKASAAQPLIKKTASLAGPVKDMRRHGKK